jgi:hypothetical protein
MIYNFCVLSTSMLTLIGTVQDDIDGPKRLSSLLHQLSPGMVCVQMQEGLQLLYQEMETSRKARISTEDFLGQMLSCKEYDSLIPIQYCRENHVQFARVGYPDLPITACIEIAKNFSWDVFEHNVRQEYAFSSLKEHRETIASLYAEQTEPPSSDIWIMDTYMEHRIRDAMKSTDGDVVFVGSNGHLFGTYHNLYERLSDLRPKRIRLCDVLYE